MAEVPFAQSALDERLALACQEPPTVSSKLQSAAKPGGRPYSPLYRAPLLPASHPDREACLPTPGEISICLRLATVLSSSTLHCTTRGFSSSSSPRCSHTHTELTHRAYEILSVPPDNKPTLAHSALLSWLRCHLPRHSGGLGARGFWFAGSRFRAFPHHKFEANFPTL